MRPTVYEAACMTWRSARGQQPTYSLSSLRRSAQDQEHPVSVTDEGARSRSVDWHPLRVCMSGCVAGANAGLERMRRMARAWRPRPRE